MKKLLLSLACVLTLGAVSASAADPDLTDTYANPTSTLSYRDITFSGSASGVSYKFAQTYGNYAKAGGTGCNYQFTAAKKSYVLNTTTKEGYKLKSISFQNIGTASFTVYASDKAFTDSYSTTPGGIEVGTSGATTKNITIDFTTLTGDKAGNYSYFYFLPSGTCKFNNFEVVWEKINTQVELTDFTALPSEISLMVGDKTALTTEELPSTIQFTPSSDFVAVSTTGVVTGIHEGTGEIEATWEADSKYNAGNATISVTVTPKQKTIYTGFPAEKSLTEGQTYALADINTPKNIIYSTSDKNVVSVSDEGVLTAGAPGSATISIMWDEDEDYLAGEAEITVTVTEKKRLTYELPEVLELTVGDTKALLGENHPTDIFFLSDDENIVTVSDEGVVTAIAAGTTTIAAAWDKDDTYNAGNAIISVTVKEAPAGVTYQLVKSVSELNTTDTYIFVSYGTFTVNNVTSYFATSSLVNSNGLDATAIPNLASETQPAKIVLDPEHTFHEYQLQENGEYYAIYDITGEKYIGAGTSTNMNNNASLPTSGSTLKNYQIIFSDVTDSDRIQVQSVAGAGNSTARAFSFRNTGTLRNYAASNISNNGEYLGVAIYKKVAQTTEPEELTFEHTIFNHNYGIVFSAGQNAGTRHNDEAITDDFTYEIRHNYPEEDNLTVYVKLDVHAAPAGDDPSIDQPDIMAKEGFTAYEAGSKITVPTKSIGTLEYYAEKADAEGNVTHRSPVYTLNFTDDTSAVDAIEIDSNTTVEYFNLQGVKVVQPAAGLYIVKRGNTVTKELVK